MRVFPCTLRFSRVSSLAVVAYVLYGRKTYMLMYKVNTIHGRHGVNGSIRDCGSSKQKSLGLGSNAPLNSNFSEAEDPSGDPESKTD